MKWLYENNEDDSARFSLGEYSNKYAKTLICVGINPSTASPNNLDPTLKKVKAIATLHGYANWIMINVHPQRSANPKKLDSTCNLRLHKKNMQVIKKLFVEFCNADILFAYGNLIASQPYLQDCLSNIIDLLKETNFAGQYYCLKQTKKGNPAHPLYQKANSVFMPYHIFF